MPDDTQPAWQRAGYAKPQIVITPDTCFGRPRMAGTRLYARVLGQYALTQGIEQAMAVYRMTREEVDLAVWWTTYYRDPVLRRTPLEATDGTDR